MKRGCVLLEMRVFSRPGISKALLQGQRPHIGSGLLRFGRRPAGLGLVFWFFANSDGSSSVQSLVPTPEASEFRRLFSSSPARRRCPLGFSATSAAPPPASRRGGAEAREKLPRRSEGNHPDYRPLSAAGVPRGGPRVAQVISRREHTLLSWAASRVPGCRMLGPPLLPPAWRPAANRCASCLPNLNSWETKCL